LLLSASIAVEKKAHQQAPKWIQKDSKGMNQQAQSNYNTGIVQSSFRTEHHQSNFKTLSQISQQSQPQATTPVGDVACSF
jgi:hypothetical protein